MGAIKKSNQIVDQMKTYWLAQIGGGGFHFGYPQEVDDIHSKTLPLMVLNPPEMQISTIAFNKNTIEQKSNGSMSGGIILKELELILLWQRRFKLCEQKKRQTIGC